MLATVAQSIVVIALAAGCQQPVNPSFAVSAGQARLALKQMERNPRPQARPLVLLGGYQDPGLGTSALTGQLRGVFQNPQIVTISYPLHGSFDSCRRHVIEALEKRLPSNDPGETVELDVVGVSMGGLVARHCAIERPGEKRLKIRRLFTVSSPHRGAQGAALPALTALHRDMREGSGFRGALAAAENGNGAQAYEVVPYVRLGDAIVGAANAAPEGMGVWWVSNPPLQSAHMGAALDARIMADIARRLRGEKPFTRGTPAALPTR